MTGMSERPRFAEIHKISDYLIQKFTEMQFNKIFLVFNKFISMAESRPTLQQLLPINLESVRSTHVKDRGLQFSYEPGPQEIFLHLIPNFVSTTVYNAFLYSATSEISARRAAMKAASDNAENMIFELQKQYNKARQTQITRELSEIISSSEAISKFRR
jgi:F-type H+-transporting ATPase subunit gamma